MPSVLEPGPTAAQGTLVARYIVVLGNVCSDSPWQYPGNTATVVIEERTAASRSSSSYLWCS